MGFSIQPTFGCPYGKVTSEFNPDYRNKLSMLAGHFEWQLIPPATGTMSRIFLCSSQMMVSAVCKMGLTLSVYENSQILLEALGIGY